MTEGPTLPPGADDDHALHKMLVRLVAGGIGEGIDRLKAINLELDAADDDSYTPATLSFQANPVAMTLVGWVSEWPEQFAAARSGAQRMAYPFTRAIGLFYDTGVAVAQATGLADAVASMTAEARVALADELDRLVKVGTAEYARGRVLSAYAFERSVDGIVGYLGESDELEELVREQTLGVTGAAVQEIRETGAAADGLAEGVVRRLLGRDRRPMPPKPVTDST
ncbi:MAG: hypothetical protein ABFR95_07570 [Actinomycetota bacterium]